MDERRAFALLRELLRLEPEKRRAAAAALPPPALRAVAEAWFWQAHGGQKEPKGDWRVWLLMAGRGFGKTRAGAEWVWARARAAPGARIALVGGNLDEIAKVMVAGPSGLRAVARRGEEALWVPSKRTFRFASGAEAFAYSAERPDALRGPEHHFAWCDELAKWARADATWDNLMLGLRKGEKPRVLVTTTPKPVPLLLRIRGLARFEETKGRCGENLHLPDDFLDAMEAAYGGTRLGRQELNGELIEDVEGALWPRALIEKRRGSLPFLRRHCEERSDAAIQPGSTAALDCFAPLAMTEEGAGFFRRVVVGVDPPASAAGTCGISVCGQSGDGILHVLADESESGLSPNGWALKVARTVEAWGADRVVAEANNGGDMVKEVLKAAAPALPLKLVHASRGKTARAEPVAALFENGEARFAGRFPALEDELAGMTTGGTYKGPGLSPDRADAMVWAMTELMPPRREPRVRSL